MISIARIEGQSMAPTFASGDYVLGVRPFFASSLRVGQVVVIEHPQYGKIVKRIQSISASGGLSLSGDGGASVASCELTELCPRRVVMKAFLVISRRGLSLL